MFLVSRSPVSRSQKNGVRFAKTSCKSKSKRHMSKHRNKRKNVLSLPADFIRQIRVIRARKFHVSRVPCHEVRRMEFASRRNLANHNKIKQIEPSKRRMSKHRKKKKKEKNPPVLSLPADFIRQIRVIRVRKFHVSRVPCPEVRKNGVRFAKISNKSNQNQANRNIEIKQKMFRPFRRIPSAKSVVSVVMHQTTALEMASLTNALSEMPSICAFSATLA